MEAQVDQGLLDIWNGCGGDEGGEEMPWWVGACTASLLYEVRDGVAWIRVYGLCFDLRPSPVHALLTLRTRHPTPSPAPPTHNTMCVGHHGPPLTPRPPLTPPRHHHTLLHSCRSALRCCTCIPALPHLTPSPLCIRFTSPHPSRPPRLTPPPPPRGG